MKLPVALLLGPRLDALSGISTHLNLLLRSGLANPYSLVHFQVGSEGRNESGATRWVRLLSSPFLLVAAIVQRRASIVHLNTALNARAYWRDLAYMTAAKLCGARVLFQVHGGALPQAFFGPNRVLQAILRATLRLPDAIVVLASAELEAFRDFVPGQQVRMLPNAVDCASYAALARNRSGQDEPLQLLYLGRLARGKGVRESLQGLKLALARGVRAELVIAGSGPEETSLKQAARQLSLGSKVAFVGPVSGDHKHALLRRADATILASEAEGLPYALLESMAAGVPAIATRVGAIPDVVADGVHGVLIARADPEAIARAIAAMASNRILLARMSEACRVRISKSYTIDRLAQEFCRLYASICNANCRADAART